MSTLWYLAAVHITLPTAEAWANPVVFRDEVTEAFEGFHIFHYRRSISVLDYSYSELIKIREER